MKKIITLLFFTFLFQGGFAQWTSLQTLPVARSGGTSFAIGTKGYTLAGGGSCGCYRNDLWVYDSGTDTWTQLVNYPSGQDNSPVAFAIGDTGYVGTGAAGGYSYSNSFYKYDPNGNTWTSIANVPVTIAPNTTQGRCAGVAFVINGKGYIGGGLNSLTNNYGNNDPHNDFYVYDPSTGQWDSIARCPARGIGVNGVAFAINGKGYVGTGGNFPPGSQTWAPQSDFWSYDPGTDTWDSVAPMPCGPRMAGIGYADANKGYVGGGVSDAGQSNYLKDFWQFDPTVGMLGKWTRLEDLGGTGLSKPSCFVISDNGYVCGGTNNTGTSVGDLWKYIPDGIVINTGTTLDIEPKSFQVCKGELVALTVVGQAGSGTSLVWSPSANLNKPTGDTVLATITQDIVYTVSSGGVCATASGTDTIRLKPSNPLIFTPANPTACPGQSIPISVSGGSNFTWNPSTGVVPGGDSLIASLPQNADSIRYIVIGLNQQGCHDTASVTLHSGGSVDRGHVTYVRDTICQNTPGNLSWLGNSGNAVQWQSSPDDINYTSISGATSTSYKTTPLQQSTWYHVVVGAGNCSSTSDSVQLYVPLPLTANFNYTQSTSTQLSFNSDSSGGNIRSYHWDFGDGNTSIEQNPSHTYAKDSTYYVCLTLYDGSNCSYTFCRYSLVTGIPTVAAMGNWVIYPDPFTNELNISAKNGGNHVQSVEMYDVLGQLVVNKIPGNSSNTSLQLDVSSLAKGMYYVMIRTATADYIQKVKAVVGYINK